jgi:hypothetical protein
MVIAALVGFFFGAGMNEAMGGAILLSMITGFACTIASFIPAPKKKPTNAAITIRMIEMITLIIYTSINKNLTNYCVLMIL